MLGGSLGARGEFGHADASRTASWPAVAAGATQATITCPDADPVNDPWTLFSDASGAWPAAMAAQHDTRWFRRGLIVNLTNPKVMLFFVAFLPQFLGSASNPFLQLLMLGLIFQVVGLAGDLTVGWTAAVLREKVLARPRAVQAMTFTSAGVFAALALVVTTEAIRSLAAA